MPSASPAARGTDPKNRSPSRPSTPASPMATATTTVQRTRSVRTGGPTIRGSATRGRGGTTTSRAGRSGDDESQAESAAMVEDLKSQLRKAETSSEDYQKQLYVLQSRLDEAMSDHAKLEETANENSERVESLQKANQDATRRHKELEAIYESDKSASLREREEAMNREEELGGVIQRLKDTLAQREARKDSEGEFGNLSPNFRGRASPNPEGPPSIQARDTSQNSSKLVLQKDKVIESLRLELAEAQIKLVELENKGGGHLHELEKMLLEARMSNAKLMEDNESYQVLLSEKTLNGDFSKSGLLEPSKSPAYRPRSPHSSSNPNLADELEGASDHGDEDDGRVKRLEAELNAQKDQNKALTLYINKIISRLLANEQFETLFQEAQADADEPIMPPPTTEKDLPAPPPPDKDAQSQAPSLLQRAGSIFAGTKKQRPQHLQQRAAAQAHAEASSGSPPQTSTNTEENLTLPKDNLTVHKRLSANLNEDPNTAPSLPLRRSASNRGPGGSRAHRRSNSDWSASVVNNMYRGPPSGGSNGAGGGALSPTSISSPRQSSFFAAPPPALILEDNEAQDGDSIDSHPPTRSEAASDSGYADSVAGSVDRPPSPRSAASAALEGKTATLVSNPTPAAGAAGAAGASWFTRQSAQDSKMRPLRLVQERTEAEEAEKKRQNRGSFMAGWFSKGAEPMSPPASQQASQ